MEVRGKGEENIFELESLLQISAFDACLCLDIDCWKR